MLGNTIRVRGLRRLLSGGLFSLAVLGAARGALAEPTAQERSLAEALFRDAKALADAEKYEEACPKLEESHRLDPKPGTMLNLAVCREKQGKTASAWSDYLEAATLASRAGQKEREAFARERAEALEKEVARLRVNVAKGTPGISVKLDGTVLNEAAWGTAAAIDPGEHLVEATAPGFSGFSMKITIERGPKGVDVTVPALVPAARNAPHGPDGAANPKTGAPPEEAPKYPPPAGPKEAAPGPTAPASSGMPTRLVPGVIVGGVGLAGLVVGTIFGVKTLSSRDDSGCVVVSESAVRCSPAGAASYEQAQTASLISTLGFGAGVALLGAGVVIVVTSPRAAAPPGRPSSAFVYPILGRGAAGVSAGFSF